MKVVIFETLEVAHIVPWSLGNLAVRRLFYLPLKGNFRDEQSFRATHRPRKSHEGDVRVDD